MKRIIFCFDGTANKIKQGGATNVLLLAASIDNNDGNTDQIIYYEEGVGNIEGRKLRDGATGKGLYDKIKEAYEFLCFNYVAGDEIFVFGFSRGAYTARSFCGFVHYNGIMKRARIETVLDANHAYRKRDTAALEDQDTRYSRYNDRVRSAVPVCCSVEEQYYRVQCLPDDANASPADFPLISIKYLGVWDTVKTLTYGDGEDDHEFHIDDVVEIVDSARHAVAIDEYRKEFDVTLIKNIEQANAKAFEQDNDLNMTLNEYFKSPKRKFQEAWFPGTHSSCGGGGDIRGLSDAALLWVLEGAKKAGLKLDTTEIGRVFNISPDPRADLDNTSKDDFMEFAWTLKNKVDGHQRRGPRGMHEVSRSTILRVAYSQYDDNTKDIYDPGPLTHVWSDLRQAADAFTAEDFKLCLAYSDEAYTSGSLRTVNGKDYYVLQILPGEYLGVIAKHWLGGTQHILAILSANKIMVPNANTIQAGQFINLPMNDFLKARLDAT